MGKTFLNLLFIMYWAGDGILAALLCMMSAYGVVDGYYLLIGAGCISGGISIDVVTKDEMMALSTGR
jgi:hypothetical protein